MATKLDKYGVDRIYTIQSEVNEGNILEVLKEIMPAFDNKSKFQRKLLDIVRGKTDISDGIRSANEKTRINQIKALIMLTTSIMFNKELSLVPYQGKEQYKSDVELIVNLLRAENAHQKDMELNIYAQSTGEAFLYTLGTNVPARGNVRAKYFKIGVFEPHNTCAVYSQDLSAMDEIVLTVHRSEFKNTENRNIVRLVCFDNKNKYIIDNDSGEYQLVGTPTPHEMPFNPIGYVQNDIFRQSMTEDLLGLQDTLNLALSNFNNDILIKVNQILLLVGIEKLTAEQQKQLKTDGILAIRDGVVTFVESTTIIKDLVDALVIIRNIMFEMAFAPTLNATGRAETGKAVETANGHTLSNFMSNMREYMFFDAKRKQIDNIIEILRINKLITSNISASDIMILFDQSRLTNFTEALDNFIKQINNDVDPYLAASNSKCFENPKEIAISVEENRRKRLEQEIKLKGENTSA